MRIPFVTFREVDETGTLRYYILQKDFPHNLGKILSQPDHEAIVQSIVPAYNLYIVWSGTLRGNMIAAYPDYKKELQQTFDQMATFFYTERILVDEKRYSKFKIK